MTFEQTKKNIQYGDYNILQKILDSPTVAAARMRFLREDTEAIEAMKAIQENREEFITKYLTDNKTEA